jgi:hypothetical protein
MKRILYGKYARIRPSSIQGISTTYRAHVHAISFGTISKLPYIRQPAYLYVLVRQ